MNNATLQLPVATDGELARRTHESRLERSWAILRRFPDRLGVVEQIVEGELVQLQFFGEVSALDRLSALVAERRQRHPHAAETELVAARMAATLHDFDAARTHLARAAILGAERAAIDRAALAIDQALHDRSTALLDAREAEAFESGSAIDFIMLGALLADRGEIEAADAAYDAALHVNRDPSPFPLAWAAFQRGVLWAEVSRGADLQLGMAWYKQALEYLPGYVRARIHLAEAHLDVNEAAAAECLLAPVVGCGDPDVLWRLSQAFAMLGRLGDAEEARSDARKSYERLTRLYPLAFGDHVAAFSCDDMCP